MTKERLAAINASLNGTSALLLVLAFVFIKRRQVRLHATAMIAAISTSAIFLVTYISSYVFFGERSSGVERGPLKTLYLALLASHVLLAVGMLPMIFAAFFRAYQRDWVRHHKIASPAFWIWLYVSITGVVVYWMLYHLFPSMRG